MRVNLPIVELDEFIKRAKAAQTILASDASDSLGLQVHTLDVEHKALKPEKSTGCWYLNGLLIEELAPSTYLFQGTTPQRPDDCEYEPEPLLRFLVVLVAPKFTSTYIDPARAV